MIEVGTLVTYIAIVLGFVFIMGSATMLIMDRSSSSAKRVLASELAMQQVQVLLWVT
jgi:hypothetical protein|tara:strand:- start:1252 stop:1422 length:171 start_codon:yes stop_codon:yes gene_type:complete